MSSQVALFFNSSLGRENFSQLRQWIQANNFDIDKLFDFSDSAPKEFPLLQAIRQTERGRVRINISIGRADLFFETNSRHLSFEQVRVQFFEDINRIHLQLITLGIGVGRIGCINTFFRQISNQDTLSVTQGLISDKVNQWAGQGWREISIRVNAVDRITTPERTIDLNKIIQILSGSASISQEKNDGIILIIDVNNVPSDDVFSPQEVGLLLNVCFDKITDRVVNDYLR